MGTARRLYERFRQLIHEAAAFGIIGVVGVVIYNVVNHVLYVDLGVGPLKSATVAVIVTTVISYVANRYWSFRHRERTTIRRETIMFFALNGIGLLIQYACVGFATYVLDQKSPLANFIANNIGIALGTLFRFWSYRKWVWSEPQPAPAGHEELEPAMAARGDDTGTPR